VALAIKAPIPNCDNEKNNHVSKKYSYYYNKHQNEKAGGVEENIFKNSCGTFYVTVFVDDHLETWSLFSAPVYRLVRRELFLQRGETPSDTKIKNELKTLSSLAEKRHEVHVRFAGHGSEAYLDLGGDKWEQVRITADGWSVISSLESPVKFTRPNEALPLPYPEPGGSLEAIRDILNLDRNEHEWMMLVSWLVGTLQPAGAYPLLFIYGEQGSAKSTATQLIRSLVDPSTIPLRTLPRSERDLSIAASRAWMLAYDNVSTLSPKLSDAFCRLATGGGFATRQLYTDTDEIILTSKRPIIMNGITNFAERQDLMDRGIVVNMPTIAERNRKPERDIEREWKAVKPRVLGALCDAVVEGLRNVNELRLDNPPRMADFAHWVSAVEPGLPWDNGRFLDEYERNRFHVQDLALEAEPVALAILEFMTDREEWIGTASELLTILSELVRGEQRRLASWPKAPHTLSGRIKRTTAYLRARDIEVEFAKSGKRTVTLRKRSD
jgi:hypothetical protein